MRWQRGSREMRGQHPVAAGSHVQKIQETQEMLRHGKQSQRVPQRRGIHHDAGNAAPLQRFVNGQQPRHFRHSRQRAVQQRLDLSARKEGAALQHLQDRPPMLAEKSLHLLFGINLPIPETTRRLSHARRSHRTGGSRQRENIRQRMCGIGGEQ